VFAEKKDVRRKEKIGHKEYIPDKPEIDKNYEGYPDPTLLETTSGGRKIN